MAKTMFSNLNIIAQNTRTDNIKMIDIDELHDCPDNFFEVNRIDELAEAILDQGGIKDNLVVRPLETGGYEIISGHRRKAAIRLLLDSGESISRFLPCLVQHYADDSTRMADLIMLNLTTRQLSDKEKWQSYEALERIFSNEKSQGNKFGRTRERLAQSMGVSTSQIGKMENISHHAIPEVIDALKSGDISISTANEIARLETTEQAELMEQGVENISHKDLRKKNLADRTAKRDKEKKVDIYVTNSEDTPAEEGDQKVDIYVKKQEKPQKKDISEQLAHFVHEHYYDLESIFLNYTSQTDDQEEIRLLEEFQALLRQSKEAERNKVRLG